MPVWLNRITELNMPLDDLQYNKIDILTVGVLRALQTIMLLASNF